MKITYFVNTMLMIEGSRSRVLCDPWVTFDRSSESGLYNFPESDLTREEVAALAPDFIYVTHTHPDHYDPPTLRLFDRDTPVLVAEYARDFTARSLRQIGFRDVHIVPSQRGMALNGDDWCWLEPAAVNPELDSIGVFRIDGMTALNANDNVFQAEQCVALRERAGGIDIGLLPSGAHGPWPMFFHNLSPAEKAAAAKERELRIKLSLVNYIDALRPRWVVPIAGGLMAGGDKARQYRYSGNRPRSEAVAFARERVDFESVLLSHRNAFDFRTGERFDEYVEKTYETEAAYIEALAATPSKFSAKGRFHVASSERVDLTRLLTAARANQRKWQLHYGGKVASARNVFFFDVGDRSLYRLSLADDEVTRVRDDAIQDAEYEIFILPYELLLGLVTRHYVWSNVKTQHVDYHRAGPFDPHLQLLMNFFQV